MTTSFDQIGLKREHFAALVVRMPPRRQSRQLFWRVMEAFAILGAFQLCPRLAQASQAFVQLSSGLVDPETLTVNDGDTVVFGWADSYFGFVQSYTGEWKSPVMTLGQTFSYTFTRAGRYVYQAGQTNGPFFPGVINVQAVTGAYPAVWITTPLNQFIVPGYSVIGAATTNLPASVRSVDFYADGEFVGSATNSPYGVTVDFSTNLGTYAFTASVIDTGGRTNTSAPVWITFANPNVRLFQPSRLPEGQTVLYVSGLGPWCINWSADLRTWNIHINGQLWGRSVVVDETTTNVTQRFYYIEGCLSASSELGLPSRLSNVGTPPFPSATQKRKAE